MQLFTLRIALSTDFLLRWKLFGWRGWTIDIDPGYFGSHGGGAWRNRILVAKAAQEFVSTFTLRIPGYDSQVPHYPPKPATNDNQSVKVSDEKRVLAEMIATVKSASPCISRAMT